MDKINTDLYKFNRIILALDRECTKNEYSCKNHKCIPKALKCNGKNDCGDNSDETMDCIGRIL